MSWLFFWAENDDIIINKLMLEDVFIIFRERGRERKENLIKCNCVILAGSKTFFDIFK